MMTTDELHVVYGTGPVGTAVVELLVTQGKRVRVVSRSGTRKHLPAQVELVRGDATDPDDTRRACGSATHVYNCTPLARAVPTAAARGAGGCGGQQREADRETCTFTVPTAACR